MNVVITPEVVDVGVVVHKVTPLVPVRVHAIEPVGAIAPEDPVTVAVKTKFPLSAPVPAPVSTISGAAFAIETLTGAVAESDV
jgi:hypothetical protein